MPDDKTRRERDRIAASSAIAVSMSGGPSATDAVADLIAEAREHGRRGSDGWRAAMRLVRRLLIDNADDAKRAYGLVLTAARETGGTEPPRTYEEGLREAARMVRKEADQYADSEIGRQKAITARYIASCIESLAASTPPATPSAPDPLHPTGRCTCVGEGKCDWCRWREGRNGGFDSEDHAPLSTPPEQPRSAAPPLTYAEGKRDAARRVNDAIAEAGRVDSAWAGIAAVRLGPLLSELASLDESAAPPGDDSAKERAIREAAYRDFIEQRGVETVCKACGGFGVRAYGDTSTWRRRAGGQMITADVCDSCWGSGDSDRPWPNRRRAPEAAPPGDARDLLAELKEQCRISGKYQQRTERLEDALRRVLESRDHTDTHEGVQAFGDAVTYAIEVFQEDPLLRPLLASTPEAPPRTAAPRATECTNHSPPWFTAPWRDWHRGHGCNKDDGKPKGEWAAREIAEHDDPGAAARAKGGG